MRLQTKKNIKKSGQDRLKTLLLILSREQIFVVGILITACLLQGSVRMKQFSYAVDETVTTLLVSKHTIHMYFLCLSLYCESPTHTQIISKLNNVKASSLEGKSTRCAGRGILAMPRAYGECGYNHTGRLVIS